MTTTLRGRSALRISVAGWIVSTVFTLVSFAQTASTGLVTGRVFNPSSGEYVRNVEIRIQGTQQVAISEDGGYYRLPNAPVERLAKPVRSNRLLGGWWAPRSLVPRILIR